MTCFAPRKRRGFLVFGRNVAQNPSEIALFFIDNAVIWKTIQTELIFRFKSTSELVQISS